MSTRGLSILGIVVAAIGGAVWWLAYAARDRARDVAGFTEALGGIADDPSSTGIYAGVAFVIAGALLLIGALLLSSVSRLDR